MTGQEIKVECPNVNENTVKLIKDQIYAQLGIPNDLQRLIIGGKELSNPEMLICDSGLNKLNPVVHCVMRI